MAARKWLGIFATAGVLSAAVATGAQPLCTPGVWECRGGSEQGAITAITSVPILPAGTSIVFIGTESAGVYKTSDRGVTFDPIAFGCPFPPCLMDKAVTALAVPAGYAGATFQVVFAGAEDGVYRSAGGGPWQRVLDTDGQPVTALAISPDFDYDAYLSDPINRKQHIFASVEDGGVYRSVDAGDFGTWVDISGNLAPDDLDIAALAIAPDYRSSAPTHLFAASRVTARGGGAIHSLQGPGEWSRVAPQAAAPTSLTSIALSSQVPFDGWLWAGSETGTLFVSNNMDQSQPDLFSRCNIGEPIQSLWLSPLAKPTAGDFPRPDRDRLLVGTAVGIFLSTDGGGASGQPCAFETLASDSQFSGAHFPAGFAQDPWEIWMAGSADGLFVGTFADPSCEPKLRSRGMSDFDIQQVRLSPNFCSDKAAFAGSGSLGLLKSRDHGASWLALNNFQSEWDPRFTVEPEINDLDLSPLYDDTDRAGTSKHLYVATWEHGVFRSSDGGWSFQPANGSVEGSLNTPEARNATALRVSPHYREAAGGGDATVILGTWGAGVWRFDASREMWIQASGQDGKVGPEVHRIALSNVFRYSMAGSAPAERVIFAATSTGLYLTGDYGGNWNLVLFQAETPDVIDVAVSPKFDGDGIAFAVMEGSGIFRSTNGGTSWEQVNAGLVYPDQVTHVAFSPDFAADGILYAGGEDGRIYRSDSAGADWKQVGDNLPTVLGPMQALTGGSPCGGFAAAGAEAFLPSAFAAFAGTHVLRSADFAQNFEDTTGYTTLPASVTGLATSKHQIADTGEQALFAASPQWGLFVSFDEGWSWRPFGSGLVDENGYPAGGALSLAITEEDYSYQYMERLLVGTPANGISYYDFSPWSSYGPYDYRDPWVWQGSTSQSTGGFANITVFPDEQPYWIDGDVDPIYASDPYAGLYRSADGGYSWTRLTAGQVATSSDMAFGEAGVVAQGGPGAGRPGSGRFNPFAGSGFVWSSSLTAGVSISSDGGSSFVYANGSDNNTLPNSSVNSVLQIPDGTVMAGLNANGGSRVGGVAWTPDEGATTWVLSQGIDEGLSNIRDFLRINSNGDVLCVGQSIDPGQPDVGGVFLSGDGGRHWTSLDTGIDPENQSLNVVVADSSNPPVYYTGANEGGTYASTIEANPYPTVSSLSAVSGPASGGTSVTITGTGFLEGCVCVFGGVDAPASLTNSTSLTCTTPAHVAGVVDVGVRNSDTRYGGKAGSFTYSGSTGTGSVTITRPGGNVTLSWTGGGGGIYTVTRSTKPNFSDPEAVKKTFTVYYGTTLVDTEASGDSQTYYYQVE